MQATLTRKFSWPRTTPLALRALPGYFLQPLRVLRAYRREYLRGDLIAGLTVGVVSLPQGIAFALLAGLPAEMGIYTSVLAAIIGALWGSSNQLSSGPTNNASLLTFSVLLPVAVPGTALYISAAGLLAVMAGLLRIAMGIARLGVLVNFVSDSVIVGFTGGAGILIIIGQLRTLLGLKFPSTPSLIDTITNLFVHAPETHIISALLGIITIVAIIVIKKINKTLPAPLLAMILAGLLVALFKLDQRGVSVLAALTRSLPHLTIPPLRWNLISDLSSGALAVATIGLVEAMSIARVMAAQTGQRLDSNQEFVGQGLANTVSGFFGGFTASGSFNRSALNFEAGARTPVAGLVAGISVLAVVWAFAPLAVYVPSTAIAALLIVSAYSMINQKEIARIWNGTRGDRIIMLATMAATLLLPLQFAVLTGVLMSLVYYIWTTSLPRVVSVGPDAQYKHFVRQADSHGHALRPACPQLGILEIHGDIYFGAAPNVEEAVVHHRQRHPEQRFLLLRMVGVARIDISGIHMLESVLRSYREQGGDVFLMRVHDPVHRFMTTTGFTTLIGEDHILDDDEAITRLFYHVLDPAVCIYECDVRVFKECQNLPKQALPSGFDWPTGSSAQPVTWINTRDLWSALRSTQPPLLFDVREPREFHRAHIPQAQLLPLSKVLAETATLPRDTNLVLVCRSGRRSTRAAQALMQLGFTRVAVLQGGLTDWEAAGLLEAVDLQS